MSSTVAQTSVSPVEPAFKLAAAVPSFAPALATWLAGLGFPVDARRLCPDLELVPS